jgi:1-acyl-sn-glycerol-3-phosphate acyltransferase
VKGRVCSPPLLLRPTGNLRELPVSDSPVTRAHREQPAVQNRPHPLAVHEATAAPRAASPAAPAATPAAPAPRAPRLPRRHHHPAGPPARRPEDRLDIRLLQLLDVTIARMYHRTYVNAPQRLPLEGPAILVCNHISGLDPLMIQSVCPRAIVWMMAREYYDIKILNWFFRTINAIPVDRSGRDLAPTRAALRALGEGRVLGIFPEGRIEETHDLLPFQTGVAMMAIKTGVPVYPAYLDGTQRRMPMLRAFLTPNEATLSFGPPVVFHRTSTSKEALEAATGRIQEAVENLKRAQESAAASRGRGT